MGAPLLLPRRYSNTQPQQALRVDPSLGADFAWIASQPKASLAGPAIASGTFGQIATERGLAVNSGYLTVASAAIPSLYATTWTEVGAVLLDGVTQVSTISARDTGQAVRFIPASSTIDFVMWTIADVNVNGTLPTGVVRYVVRRNGAVHTVWLNGRLFGSASASNTPAASNGTLPAVGAQAGSGGNQGAAPLVATTGVLAVVRTGLALPDALCQRLSDTPWQLFPLPSKALPLASAAAGISLGGSTLTPSGGTASLSTGIGLAASAQSISAGAVQLDGAIILGGVAQTAGGAAAALTTALGLGAAAQGSASAVASLATSIALAGTATTGSAAGAALAGGAVLAGAASTGAGASSTLQSAIALAAAAVTAIDAHGTLGTGIALQGSAAAAGWSAAALATAVTLAGAGLTPAQARGALQLVLHPGDDSSAAAVPINFDAPAEDRIYIEPGEDRLYCAFA